MGAAVVDMTRAEGDRDGRSGTAAVAAGWRGS